MRLRLIHRISLDLYQKREHANKHEVLSMCQSMCRTMQLDRKETDVTNK
jgi:hypothetical protein